MKELKLLVTTVVQRLCDLAARDQELQGALRQLAAALLTANHGEAAEAPQAAVGFDPAQAASPLARDIGEPEAAAAARAAPTAPAVDTRPAPRPEQLPELTLGRARPAAPAAPVSDAAARPEFSPAEIVARCRLKAEGARWAAARRRMLADGAEFDTVIDPQDREIIARAKQAGCYLWMCHPSGPAPDNLKRYEEVAGCFDVVAEALAFASRVRAETDVDQAVLTTALHLLAEAQSALRIAILAIDGPNDPDQVEAFRWLKQAASESQIYIPRYMRVDDPADPATWPELLGRIESEVRRVEDAARACKLRKKLLDKVRHKAGLIASDPAESPGHWEALVETVRALVADGLPPSNRQLRELLLPVIDQVPDFMELPREVELVVREIDKYLAMCPSPASRPAARISADVQAAAELLRGRALVLIGGDKRPAAGQALEEALALDELIWIDTRAHESFEIFAPFVARPEVAAVLLAIRWSSHSYGEVRGLCERYGKPLVRLPGGYNPNQVAAQILEQASGRLGETALTRLEPSRLG